MQLGTVHIVVRGFLCARRTGKRLIRMVYPFLAPICCKMGFKLSIEGTGGLMLEQDGLVQWKNGVLNIYYPILSILHIARVSGPSTLSLSLSSL